MKIDLTEIDDELLLKWQRMLDDAKGKESNQLHPSKILHFGLTEDEYNLLLAYLAENDLGEIRRMKVPKTLSYPCKLNPRAWSLSFIAEKSKLQRGFYEDQALKQSQIDANNATVRSAKLAKRAICISIAALIVSVLTWLADIMN